MRLIYLPVVPFIVAAVATISIPFASSTAGVELLAKTATSAIDLFAMTACFVIGHVAGRSAR